MTIPAHGYLLTIAYFAVAFGVMQAIVLGQRHLSDSKGALRMVGGVTLISAIGFAALMLLAQQGGWGLRLVTVVAFSALLVGLLALAVFAPANRFGPVSALVMIAIGTVALKSAFLWQ
ncbi:MAG: hypothetical protein AAGD47_06965 [Pseudomonadota bacterium]